MYSWIDDIIVGLIDTYSTDNVYELYDSLNIEIVKLEADNILLRGNASFYYRDFLGNEIVFIQYGLDLHLERFILCHELGHALLHPHILEATFNKSLLNKDKLEKQANYFALKLLNVTFDETELYEMTIDQVASYINIPLNSLKQFVL